MRTGTGTNQIWAREEGKHKTRRDTTDITPPSRTVRPAPYTIQRGGGLGALEASRDTEAGQYRRPPGGGARSGSHGGSGDSGGHGGAGDSGGHGGSWSSGGHGGSGDSGGHGGTGSSGGLHGG